MIGLGWLESFIHVSAAEFNFIACLLLSYPFAAIHKNYIKTVFMRHLFSLVVGLYFSFSLFEWQAFMIMIPIVVTYLMMKFGPKNSSHILVFVFNLSWVAIGHIYFIFYQYMQFTAEWTGTFMMMMIKLTNTAYNYYDGRKSEEEFNKLAEDQKYQAIKQLPSFFEYMSYCYFFPTFSVGPPCLLVDYLSFTDRTMFKDEKNGEIPSPWCWAGVGKRFALVALAVTYHLIEERYPVNYIYKNHDQFLTLPFLTRLFYIYITTQFAFYKYFFIWFNAEAACCVAGLGYLRDKKGNVTWDRVNMINFWDWYTAENGTGISKNWNVQGARWLKNTIYLRMVSQKFSRLAASLSTFTVSAIWHGFYPGYYFSFVSFSLVDAAIKSIEKYVRSHFVTYNTEGREVAKPSKLYYDIVMKVVINLTFFYMANPFMMFTMENVLKCWSSVYYFWHLFYLVLAVFFGFFGKFLPRGSVRPRVEQKKTN